MKKFPRLYSLSTVGIIHHQDYDYFFHPLRTDFVGDSGSGKSMIADLLQLILVGSDQYESATETSGEKRTVDGMVLTETSAKHGIAYAFLNIEVSANKFIVIGTYIESGNTRSKAFIIQETYDFTLGKLLSPIAKPISYTEFIIDNNAIIPIDKLTEHFFELGHGAKTWERFQEYHQFLTENRLIPIQITQSNNALENYARIIRSFSRGYKLKSSDSSKLQQFLFGNEDGYNLYRKLKQINLSYQKTMSSHAENILTIVELTKKLEKFKKLRSQFIDYTNAETDWLTTNYILCHNINEQKVHETFLVKKSINTILNRLERIRQFVESSEPIMVQRYNDADSDYSKALAENQRLVKIQNEVNIMDDWLIQRVNNNSISELTAVFQNEKQVQRQVELIEKLQISLKQHGLTYVFEQSEWIYGYERGLTEHAKKLQDLNKKIQEKQLLSQFSNLTDSKSLENWAVQLNRPLSIEEESALHYFQKFDQQPEEKPGHRFLFEADTLFTNLKARQSGEGFWINLNGVEEFVNRVLNPLFDTTDHVTLSIRIQGWNESLKTDLFALEEEEKELTRLFDFIQKTDGISDLLLAYSKKSNSKFSLNYSDWKELTEKEFTFLLTSYSEYKETIYELLKQSSALTQLSKENFLHFGVEKGWLRDIDKILSEWPKLTDYNNTVQNLSFLNTELLLELDQTGARIENESVKMIYDEIRRAQQNQVTPGNWIKTLQDMSISTIDYKEAKLEYFKKNQALPDLSLIISSENVATLKSEFDIKLGTYKSSYTNMADEYLPNQTYLVKDEEYDFLKLATEVLPGILRDKVISEEDVIDAVNNELNRINDQTRRFADTKIRQVEAIVDDLSKAISRMKQSRKDTQDFFKKQDKPISKTYNVRLYWEKGKLDEDWMEKFFKVAGKLDTPLFIDADVEKLRKLVSIEEMLEQAFTQQSGGRIASASELLNPMSYFSLRFCMESEHGRLNKGSTGQVYASLALLNIARLSIIEGDIKNNELGLRIMPIDEAEGLGSNFDMLVELAKTYDYQIITMAIGLIGQFREAQQHIYMLHKNRSFDEPINYPPFAVLSTEDAHLLTYKKNAEIKLGNPKTNE